ncbi:hypothetical protein JB92DRAFT_352464 [Gautieria morchelliformis]|nr:hypothetical protein JB92DRAFT_352464 [Gautieria morchelliformis]
MEYIFEKSSADLALVHHDDLSTLLGATTSTGVEDALCQLTPIVFVKNGVGMLESTFKAYQNTKPMNANTSMPPSIIFPEQAPLPGNASVTSHEQRAHEEERSVLSTSFLEVNVSQLCNDTAHDSRHGNEGQDRDHEDSFDTKKIPSLSLAANVISVLQFTSTALGKCYCYASPARDASRDQKRVIDQLSGLLKVLEDVYQLVDHGETGEPSGLLALTGLLNNPLGFPCCRSELESLGTVLGIEPGRGGHTQALTWPLKEADVNRTLSKLSQFQDLLATALDVDQRYLSVGGCLTVGEQSVPRARSCMWCVDGAW